MECHQLSNARAPSIPNALHAYTRYRPLGNELELTQLLPSLGTSRVNSQHAACGLASESTKFRPGQILNLVVNLD